MGQSATRRSAHSSRLSAEDSSALRETSLPPRLSTKCVEKLYILLQLGVRCELYKIPESVVVEFAELPDRSNDLLSVLNFYFTRREAESYRRSVPQQKEESPSSKEG